MTSMTMQLWNQALRNFWQKYGIGRWKIVQNDMKIILRVKGKTTEIQEAFNIYSLFTPFEEWRLNIQSVYNYVVNLQGIKVLDVGAGAGRFAFPFKNAGAEVKCIDTSEVCVEILLARGLDAELMDARDLSNLPANYYDVILLMGDMLGEIVDDETEYPNLINQFLRVLKPHGYCVGDTAFPSEIQDLIYTSGNFTYVLGRLEWMGQIGEYGKIFYFTPQNLAVLFQKFTATKIFYGEPVFFRSSHYTYVFRRK